MSAERRKKKYRKVVDPDSFGKVFLSAEEAGSCLGLSRGESYKFFKSNKIPLLRNGNRYLVPVGIVKDIQSSDFFRSKAVERDGTNTGSWLDAS